MKKILFFIAILSYAFECFGQELHIYYDAQTDLLRYESNGSILKQPKVKKGNNIFLHIQNYNNYLYEVAVSSNEKTVRVPTNGGNPFTKLLTGQGSFASLNLWSADSNKNPFGFFEEEKDKDDTFGFISNQSESSQAVLALRQEYQQQLRAVNQAEKELIGVGKSIHQEVEAQQIQHLVAKEIDKLKHHPQLKPEQIKKMASEYLQTVFNVKRIEEVDLSYVLERSNPQKMFQKHLGQLKLKEKNYRKANSNLKSFGIKVAALNTIEGNTKDLIDAIQNTYQHSESVLDLAATDAITLEKLSEEVRKTEVQFLTDLRYEYEAIMGNNFSYTYRTTAKGDGITFNIQLQPKNNLEQDIGTAKTVAPIDVNVSGGLKVDASIGIGFGRFENIPQTYFIRNDQIIAEEDSAFQPMLSSMLHFYKQSNGNTSFGGTIGIGLPISTEQSITALSFLMGPSIMIGKGNRIVLSIGGMMGQVKRLARGLQIGDTFISDIDNIPTKSIYELGYFFGVSYNL